MFQTSNQISPPIAPLHHSTRMSARTSPFNLSTCARPNILALQPYRCAREYVDRCNVDDACANNSSDYKDDGTNILLDANENAYGPALDLDKHGTLRNAAANGHHQDKNLEIDLLGLNRYPDP